jgi:SAM-dependent methyltransferase
MQLPLCSELSHYANLASLYAAAQISRTISPDDDMLDRRAPYGMDLYLRAGISAADIVLRAMMLCGKQEPETILDMPCGFGRVMRHIVALFPRSRITACDLYESRIDFCKSQFNATAVKSREDFTEIEFPHKFDLIWCGSLLTHLPAPYFSGALELFSRSLAPDGMAVISTHGRHSPFVQRHKWKYMPDENFTKAEAEFSESGFGYADYNEKDVFNEQKAYGISLSSPSFVMRCLESDKSIRIQGFMERAWDDHQDVLIIQKKGINA